MPRRYIDEKGHTLPKRRKNNCGDIVIPRLSLNIKYYYWVALGAVGGVFLAPPDPPFSHTQGEGGGYWKKISTPEHWGTLENIAFVLYFREQKYA